MAPPNPPEVTADRTQQMAERVQALRLPAPAKGATSSRLPWVVCVILGGAVLWMGYSSKSGREIENSTEAVATSAKPVVATGSDKPASTGRNDDSNVALEDKGYVIPAHQILVSPKVSGMIVNLFVVEGRKMEAGETLAELEDIEYVADRNRAAGTLNRAKATLKRANSRLLESKNGFRDEEKQQAQAELDEAQTELARLTAEYQRNVDLRSKKALTDLDFEQSEGRFRSAQQRERRLRAARDLMNLGEREERKEVALHEVEQAAADVEVAAAELAKAEWRLENCTIKAPISGTILKKNAEKGNIVNPIAFNGSFSLCEMADLSELEVELSIGERDIHQIFVGQRCDVRGDAYKERVYSGVVDRLMPIADRAKASVPVRVKVTVPSEEQGLYLKPEMGVTVTFYKRDAEKPAADKVTAEAVSTQPVQ